MRMTEIRIKNFRTIRQEQTIPLDAGMTLVGPNSSGKTNILRAIQTFFTGPENSLGYNRKSDLTFGEGESRTSITATFSGSPSQEDKDIYSAIDELHKLQGTTRHGDELSLNLYFSDHNTPVYSFFPNTKRPSEGSKRVQYSRIHCKLVVDFMSLFFVYYVPSEKNIRQLYDMLLVPFMRQLTAKALEPHMSVIQNTLNDVSDSLNEQLSIAGLGRLKTSFAIPGNSLEKLFTNFDFLLEDPSKTNIYDKGTGIQATALLASFMWVTNEHKKQNKNVIWLLEEPESYLHPELSSSCLLLLAELQKKSTLVKTTHALNFVPQDPKEVRGVRFEPLKSDSQKFGEYRKNKKNSRISDGTVCQTEVISFKTYTDATSRLREFLGVRFSDFYNLGVNNILVEGQTDREVFQWFLDLPSTRDKFWPKLRSAFFLDFGGVKYLSGFLRATYPFIRKERACVVVLDGDSAADQERRGLQNYFGQNNISFQANQDYVIVRDRFAIEGLFPDEWIIDIYRQHEKWFNDFSLDAANVLQPFDVNDKSKQQVLSELKKRAETSLDVSWQERFSIVCDAMEKALDAQNKRLGNF